MLEELKLYLKFDTDDQDEWLKKTLIPAINGYFKNAGIDVEMLKDEPLYHLAVQMLATHWNENRGVIGNTKNISFGLEAIITQLRYSYD